MVNKFALDILPFSKANQLSTLVENRRVMTFNSFEFNVFETYERAHAVPLQFQDVVLVNMLQGKKVMHLEGVASFDYFPGETLVLPENKAMHIDFPEANSDEPTQCAALTISRSKLDDVLFYLNDKVPLSEGSDDWHFRWERFHFQHDAETRYLNNKLFKLMLSNDRFKEPLADLTIRELLIRTLQNQNLSSLTDTRNSQKSVLNYLQQFIREHISSDLNVDLLSRKANMSRSALFREFKVQLGLSPMEYVIQERIIAAKRLLESGISVKEVGYAVGFNDVNYFVRLFKKRIGYTPGAYAVKFGIR